MARSLDVNVAMVVEGLQALADAGEGVKAVGDNAGTSQAQLAELGRIASQAISGVATNVNTLEEAQGRYMVATGKSREEAEQFTDSMRSLMGETTLAGISFDQIAAAGAMVEQQFGTTGDETTELTKLMLQYAQVTGSDAVKAAASMDDALSAMGLPASEASRVMDLLVASSQEYGTAAGPAALDAITKMAPALTAQNLGIEEASALLNFMAVNGVEASAGIRGLYTATLKLPEGYDSLAQYAEHLRTIDDDSQRTAEAVAVFGNRAGVALSTALAPGTEGLSAYTISTQDSEGAMIAAAESLVTSADKFTAAADKISASVMGMSESIGPLATAASEVLGPLTGMTSSLSGLKAGSDLAGGAIKLLSSGALKPLMALLVPGGKIVLAVGAALGGLKIAGGLAADGFDNAAEGARNMTVASQEDARALGIAEGAHRGMANVLNVVAPWSNAAKAAEGAAQAYEDQADSARESGFEVKSATDLIASAWAGAKTKIAGSLNGMVSDMRGMVGNVRSALSEFGDIGRNAAKSMIDGLVGGIQGGISRVQSAAQGVANKVKDIFRLGSPSKSGPWSHDGGPIAWMERNGRMMMEALERGLGSGSVNVPQINMGGWTGARVNALGGRSVAPITVNVYAGVGDPVAIGREVSNALRAYQRVAGLEA